MAAAMQQAGLRRRQARAADAEGQRLRLAVPNERPPSPAAFGWMPNAMGQFAPGAGEQVDDDDDDEEDEPKVHKHRDGCCGKPRSRRNSAEEEAQVTDDDMCSFDWGLLVEPVTLLCGHTFCRHCVGIMIDDAMQKTRGPGRQSAGSLQGTFKCPLCCRALPALLPQPNVRLRNDLRTRYPSLYDRRLKAAEDEFGERAERKGMTSDDLQNIINQHRRVADGAGGLLEGEADDDLDMDDFVDPVLDVLDMFQAELSDIWRALRPVCWFCALLVLAVGFRPLANAGSCITEPGAVEAILRAESWEAWWALPAFKDTPTEGRVCGGSLELSGNTSVFPGSELLATAYMYPSWGWVERISRGVEGCLLDGYRVINKPTPASVLTAFPGLAMAVYALGHPGWTLIFRIMVAFIAIEGEVRQFMALLAILTIPTRIPRDARDIPPLNEMPSYAWTVLSLTIAQGAYLMACEMLATLLDVAALAPMILALSKGQYWRSEASLCATVVVRVWLMLRDDVGLFRGWLGENRSSLEAAVLRGVIIVAVFTASLWAAEPLFNSTDSVSTLTHAGDELITELFDEMGRTLSA